jgi:hypothetical protein
MFVCAVKICTVQPNYCNRQYELEEVQYGKEHIAQRHPKEAHLELHSVAGQYCGQGREWIEDGESRDGVYKYFLRNANRQYSRKAEFHRE